jgi:hypothetical protein
MPSIRCVSGTFVLALSLGWLPVVAAQGTSEALATAQREDLAAFGRDFLAVDKAFTPAARAMAEQRLAALTAKAGTMSDVRMVLSLAQIVALADNGHTLMISRGSSPATARVGIRLLPFGDEFVVVQATTDHADLLGGRLVAINGVPIAAVRDSARTLTGGIASWRDRMAPAFLESPGQLQAMGLGTSAAQATYRLMMPNGKSRDVTLTNGQPSPRDRQGSVAVMYPSSTAGWQSLLPAERAPWSLQGAGETMRRRDAPELDAMVIQLRANVNGQQPIADFLAESDSLHRAAGRKHIVLDMRMNGGGNLQLTRDWMQSIVSKLPADGRVIVLTSPWTFSAAISSVGYLKQAGGDRVTLVGEAPGDRLNFFAEGSPAALPHSGAMFLVAKERHDYQTACKGYSDCHRPVVTYPIAVANLDPTVPAPWTAAAYQAGRDPGMEAVARVLGHP